VYYDYDARGNCTQREVLGGDTTYYTYNSRNLLTSVSSTESGSVATYYQYNAFDERIHEIKADGSGEKRTIWDGINPILELDGDGNLLRRYTYGHAAIDGVGGLIDVEDASGDHYFYHCDPVGGVCQLTAEDETVAKRYDYSPFGRILGETGSAPNDFTFPATYAQVSGVPDLRLSPSHFGVRSHFET
jgi:uncharacterized protein RhaS with RHS repeats